MAEDIQSDPIAHIRLDEYDIQAISTIVESTVTAEMTYQISIQWLMLSGSSSLTR